MRFFFFFKQKTAYEIYQCDWSSDVCSSDLVKNDQHRPREILGDKLLAYKYERDIVLANGEAHRFATLYHRSRRDKI